MKNIILAVILALFVIGCDKPQPIQAYTNQTEHQASDDSWLVYYLTTQSQTPSISYVKPVTEEPQTEQLEKSELAEPDHAEPLEVMQETTAPEGIGNEPTIDTGTADAGSGGAE